MAKFRDETIQYHTERVREAVILFPRASAREVVELLSKSKTHPIVLDKEYVGKLMKKIKGERKHRYRVASFDIRVAEMEDRTQTVISQMWKILHDARNSDKARVMAAKTILDADKNLLDAQMDAGIYDRKLGKVGIDVKHEHEHTVRLPDEIRIPILRALKNYGLIKRVNATVIEPADTRTASGGGVLVAQS